MAKKKTDIKKGGGPTEPSLRQIRVTSNHFPLIVSENAPHLHKHRVELSLQADNAKTLPDHFKATVVEAYMDNVAPGQYAYDRDFIIVTTKDVSADAEFEYKNQCFHVSIIRQDSFDLHHLCTIRDATLAQEPLQALEVVMGWAAREVCEPFGRKGCFLHKGSHVPLFRDPDPDCYVLFMGHGQRVHLTNESGWDETAAQELSVSFDARGEIGILEMSVEDYLQKKCHLYLKDSHKWSQQDRSMAGRALNGLQVNYRHRDGRAVLSPLLSEKNSTTYEFESSKHGGMISVQKYLLDQYKIKLKFPLAPLIGIKRRSDMLPLEVLTIATQTRRDITHKAEMACQKVMTMEPSRRRAEIMTARDLVASVPLLSHFGISISTEAKTSAALVLPPPKLLYAGNKTIMAKSGAWNMAGLEFDDEDSKLVWGVLNCTEQEASDEIGKWSQEFKAFGEKSLNVKVKDPWPVRSAAPSDSNNPGALASLSDRLKTVRVKPDFILVVKAEDDEESYKEIKRHFDRCGIVTQCVVKSKTPGLNPKLPDDLSHWTNLWAKIHTKCGRDTQRLTPEATLWHICDYETAVIGADLCHPMLKTHANHDRSSLPSYGALVCSTNLGLTRFTWSASVHLGGTDELFQMQQMIASVMAKRHAWPKRIIYLRDGISDGQIQSTMANEIKSILAAFRMAKQPAPIILAVSVRKRHHTRLFQAQPGGGRERNVESGTLCYQQLGHGSKLPHFFMVSQHGPLGTSRPTKYQVLKDDLGDKLEKTKILSLEERTRLYASALYDLCHLHGTCQKAVSLPSPVTWAHRLADRIRLTGENMARQRLEQPTPIGPRELDAFLEEMNAVIGNIQSLMTQMYWI